MSQKLARHVVEMGRIRIGHQVPIASGKNTGKPRPERLAHFRLTSNSFAALSLASLRYGGEVRPWTVPQEWREILREPEEKWELFTQTDTLAILMRADSLMSTMFERWDGGCCILRCNGEVIMKDAYGERLGHACLCPALPEERKALALQGKACQEVSRITVMLDGLPFGQWRLDTRGFYAPAEIRGMQDLLHACEVDTMILRATMRLEQRANRQMVLGKRVVQRYGCIVIEPCQSLDQLLLDGARRRLAMPRPPDEHQKALAQHVGDIYGDEAAQGLLQQAGTPVHAHATDTLTSQPARSDALHGLANDDAWRQRLLHLAADIKEFLDGSQSPEVVHRVHTTTEQGLRLAEDPDATSADGMVCIEALQLLGAMLSQQMGLPL